MYTISKQFSFSASHQLALLPADHQCARLHGHNYIIEAVLCAETPNSIGFVRDYGELKEIGAYIDSTLDHRHLNDVFECNPTAENMAKVLYDKFKQSFPELIAIRVSETSKTWAEYRCLL